MNPEVEIQTQNFENFLIQKSFYGNFFHVKNSTSYSYIRFSLNSGTGCPTESLSQLAKFSNEIGCHKKKQLY